MRRPAQALVEFALAISVFMFLVLGTFDLVRLYLAYAVMADVVREASRYGAAHAADATQASDATQAGLNLAVGIDNSPALLTLVPGQKIVGGLTYFNVKGTYRFHSITPGVAALLGDPITIVVDTSALPG
jgi:Flp pilus assembly protein TadG